MKFEIAILLALIEVVVSYRDAQIPGIAFGYRYRADNTTSQPPASPNQSSCSDSDLSKFLNCYETYLSNYNLHVANLNSNTTTPTLPNFTFFIQAIEGKTYGDNQKMHQDFYNCYTQVSPYCLYFKTMRTITLSLEQAEIYTAELSDAEMYYQNSQSANALKCFGNATIICLPDNNLHEHAMECSEANRFLRCNLFVYDDASCDPSQRGNVCRLIVTDAQRFGILDDSCRTQLDQACANNNAPTTTPTVGTTTTSNSVFRIEICSWVFVTLLLSLFKK